MKINPIRKLPFLLTILFLAIFLKGTTSQAATPNEHITVLPDENLQETINKAKEGQTIKLKKGVYKGPITIKKPLKIIGSSDAVIDGGGKGSVITIQADHVTLKGLTIENSGRLQEDSGIYLENTAHATLENNLIQNVHFGIYIKNGNNTIVKGNTITSHSGHFSQKGNGIHIFKGEGNTIEGNHIRNVQDGIYFDFASEVTVRRNEVLHSRYGMHYMFSENILTEENLTEGNITGLMIMDSKDLEYYRNKVYDQFHFRGYGILIYDTQNIVLKENRIIQNSVGISLEKSENIQFTSNVIGANQVGLEFRRDNYHNVFAENNFIGNIVSSTIGKEELRLDNGDIGNYWDDYKSYDIDGDGVGEIPYKAGSLYDDLLKRQPLWQFYFESPAIIMWTKAESMFPSFGSVEVYDNNPLVEPIDFTVEQAARDKDNAREWQLWLLSLVFLGAPFVIFLKGRKFA